MKSKVVDRAVITVSFSNIKSGWQQWILLRADAHHDNLHANHELEKKHLEEARSRKALVCDFGDLFCAMQGRWDKRKDDTQLREELIGNDYLDQLVNYNAAFYEPFADLFLMIAPGNHETANLKYHQTNLTERLAERLRVKREKMKLSDAYANSDRLFVGGFSGWIRFMFRYDSTKQTQRLLKWHHGYGGDAPVTKGVIQTNRMAVYLPDAHFVVTGHTHNEFIFPLERERISDQGILSKDQQVHIKVPGYKDEYADGYDGWHIERGGPPKPLGAAWIRFYYLNEQIRSEVTAAK